MIHNETLVQKRCTIETPLKGQESSVKGVTESAFQTSNGVGDTDIVYKTRNGLKSFLQSLQYYILTSRFNTKTWNENQHFIEKNANLKCIYCTPGPVNANIPLEAKLLVLEMNNDINRIMGIGLVINHPRIQKYNVYETGNYNRYSFVGKYRIDRVQMNEQEEKIMKLFDILCFTGNTHLKRGDGLKMFPVKMLYNMSSELDLVNFIVEMFRRKYKPCS